MLSAELKKGTWSTYFRLSEEAREARKAYARQKYHGPKGYIQKRKQYLRYLNSGLLQKCKPATLRKHGITQAPDGSYHFLLGVFEEDVEEKDEL